jgi:hypothetical protein
VGEESTPVHVVVDVGHDHGVMVVNDAAMEGDDSHAVAWEEDDRDGKRHDGSHGVGKGFGECITVKPLRNRDGLRNRRKRGRHTR